jgi:outer membrane biosynthesis protein TonB
VTRRELSPALIGSVALHLAVAAALLISWPFSRKLTEGDAVPITLVTHAPPGEPPPAAPAAEVQAAQAPEPSPPAPPEPVPPAPQPAPPKPAPAAAKPAPQPKPAKPAEKAPAAAKPSAKPEKSLDLDALAASLSKMSKAGGKPASAAHGPSKAATAPAAGKGLSASAQASVVGMKDQVERRWNPNCNVAGGRDVQLSVVFRIDSVGQVAGQVAAQIRSAQNEVARAAAERAIRAVYAAAPFRDLPRELYGQSFKLNFDAKDACS